MPTPTDPFDGFEGPRVKVSGTLVTRVDGIIDLDLFREDESAPGGRKLLGKLKRASALLRSWFPPRSGDSSWTRLWIRRETGRVAMIRGVQSRAWW